MQPQEQISKDQKYSPLRRGKVVSMVMSSSMANAHANAVQEDRMQ